MRNRGLRKNSADVSYNDPYVPEVDIGGNKFRSVALDDKRLSSTDCVIIATDHSSYNYQDIITKSKLVFDARGVTKNIKASNVIRL